MLTTQFNAFLFLVWCFFSGITTKKKKKTKKKRPTTGCWVVLSIAVMCAWDKSESSVVFHTLSLWLGGLLCKRECRHWKRKLLSNIFCQCWVCINHLVQGNRLIFSVIHTAYFHGVHPPRLLNSTRTEKMASCRPSALVSVATPCKSSVHVTCSL